MAANLKLWQSTREQNFNKQTMQRQRQAEFGAPGRGCSPTHDGDFIYRKHCRLAVPRRAGRYGRKLAVGSRLLGQVDSVTSSRPPLNSILTCIFVQMAR